MVDNVQGGIAEFEYLGLCYYETVAFRAPLQNEYYMGSTKTMVHRASTDLKNKFQVVRPTHRAKTVLNYERGETPDPIQWKHTGARRTARHYPDVIDQSTAEVA